MGGEQPTGVCVYAPSTIVTVTVEPGPDGADELHFHGGGQGFWVARLLRRLGVPVTLCSVFGGEAGRVARALAEAEGVDVRAVERAAPNGAYVHDRRSGERVPVAEAPGPPLTRHEVDELYESALATSMTLGLCVLAGPWGDHVIGGDSYRRLATDLRKNGVTVVADLSGEHLVAALEGGLDFCKVSLDDLQRDGLVEDGEDPLDAVRRLPGEGVRHLAVTRAADPLLAEVDGERVEVAGPTFETVDPRGAGDSFTAMVAASRLFALPWREALRWGAAAGALATTRRGLATVDRRDVERLVARVEVRPGS